MAKTINSSDVQSVAFDKNKFNVTEARKWLRTHGLKHTGKVDRSNGELRFRQQSPAKFRRFRRINFRTGINGIIGFTGAPPKKKNNSRKRRK